MESNRVKGTRGYADSIRKFIDATVSLPFEILHQDFLKYFPESPGRILDLGAGIGRDAFVLAQKGHSVLAVEPSEELRNAGRKLYSSPLLEWTNDSLPNLQTLQDRSEEFDFILGSGIWHHLSPEEQLLSLEKVSGLLAPNGIFALSLRHGPAGVGTTVFPPNGPETILYAEKLGLTTILFLENCASLLPNKQDVIWTKIVFQKE